MNPIPLNAETEGLARRLVWFEEPQTALADPVRLAAYAFEGATHDDMSVLRRYLSDDDLREALRGAPPGIIGPRSWAYWHARLGLMTPPLPQRNFR